MLLSVVYGLSATKISIIFLTTTFVKAKMCHLYFFLPFSHLVLIFTKHIKTLYAGCISYKYVA